MTTFFGKIKSSLGIKSAVENIGGGINTPGVKLCADNEPGFTNDAD
jgi:hypothetical protein